MNFDMNLKIIKLLRVFIVVRCIGIKQLLK